MRTLFYGLGLFLTICGLLPLPFHGYNLAFTVVEVFRFLPQGFDLALLPFAVLPLGVLGLLLAMRQRPADAGLAEAMVVALLLMSSLYGFLAGILRLLQPIMAPAAGMDTVAAAYAFAYAAWLVCALCYLMEFLMFLLRGPAAREEPVSV